MNTIQGVEKVERVLGRWHHGDLAAIEAFELNKDSQLTPVALFQRRPDDWPSFEQPMTRVTITFDNVGELSLKAFTGGMVQIKGSTLCMSATSSSRG